MKGHSIARVAKEPELRFSNDGKPWATCRVGLEARVKVDGEWKNEVTWATLKAFGPVAEQLCETSVKGTRLLVVGELKPNSYVNKAGDTVNDFEFVADEIGRASW